MAANVQTKIMVWSVAGRICCKPDCGRLLISESESGSKSLVGQVAHIRSSNVGGPRHDSTYSVEQADEFDNLLLLCSEHHKLVDDHPLEYTVEILSQWKESHEKKVINRLSESDKSEIDIKSRYGGYIDNWSEKAGINDWQEWTSSIFLADEPRMTVERYERLEKLNQWLLNRIWPKHIENLESEFENFRLILNEFLLTFSKHTVQRGSMMWTDKFYKITQWNPERYHSLYRQWLFHSKLVQDLGLELTRSANRICDIVRETLQNDFRIQEGVLLITSGPKMDLTFDCYRAEYRSGEKFNGLKNFISERESRTVCFGLGNDAEDERFKDAFNL